MYYGLRLTTSILGMAGWNDLARIRSQRIPLIGNTAAMDLSLRFRETLLLLILQAEAATMSFSVNAQ